MTTDDELEPWETQAAALLRAEHAAPPPPPGVQDRIWQQVATAGTAAGLVAAETMRQAGRFSLRQMLVSGAVASILGAGAGAWVYSVVRAPEVQIQVVTVERPVPVPVSAPTPSPAPAVTPAAPKPARSAPSSPVRATTEPAEDGVALEAALLDRARTALSRHDAAAALEALADHERRYAHGLMEEEREAMMVEALRAAGRPDDATARARAFVARYPESLHRARMERSLKGAP